MGWLREAKFRLTTFWTRGSLEQDMDEEMGFHLDMETKKLVAGGMTAERARQEAVRNFGGVTRKREQAREAWGITMLTEIHTDCRHALRQLRRNPGFAVAALLTLALGIGANTAIFSIADQALLQRPAVRDPGGLVAVYTSCRRGQPKCSSSYPDYLDYRDQSRNLEDLAAFSSVPLSVGNDDATRLATGHLVTGNFFELLGVQMHLGRPIETVDDVRDGASPVVVLGFDFGRRRSELTRPWSGPPFDSTERPSLSPGWSPKGSAAWN
jgi:hypothetical protein